MQKQHYNFNKSIKDKERKILEYYRKKTNQDKPFLEKPLIKKRTKKNNPKSLIQQTATDKLTKTAKLPIPESTKPKIVNMD